MSSVDDFRKLQADAHNALVGCVLDVDHIRTLLADNEKPTAEQLERVAGFHRELFAGLDKALETYLRCVSFLNQFCPGYDICIVPGAFSAWESHRKAYEYAHGFFQRLLEAIDFEHWERLREWVCT